MMILKLRVTPDGMYYFCLETENYRIPFHYESKRKEWMIQNAHQILEDFKDTTFEEDLSESHRK